MNKRKHSRYPLFATAVITAKESGKYSSPIETMVAIANISLSGMGLYSYTPVEKGTEVSIEISFVSDKGIDRKDRIEGKIVWLSTQERLHFMGIAFDKEMNPGEQPFLYDYFLKVVTSK